MGKRYLVRYGGDCDGLAHEAGISKFRRHSQWVEPYTYIVDETGLEAARKGWPGLDWIVLGEIDE